MYSTVMKAATINNLSLHKSIIRKGMAQIQSGKNRLCASCAQNDALDATRTSGSQRAA